MIVKEPTVETLEEERQLILREKDDKKRGRLLATAITIASRYFERDFLWQFFREEVEQTTDWKDGGNPSNLPFQQVIA